MSDLKSLSQEGLVSPIDLVAAALECDPASLTSGSGLDQHPNWDSFGHLAVMVALEQCYGVKIDDATIRQFECLQAIESLYIQLVAGSPKA